MIDSEELKSRIEAILYAAGKPVTLGMIMRICQTRSRKRVLEVISELKKRYEGDSSALELLELPGGRYYLKLKRRYMELVKRILKKPLLSRGVMRTLSFIAYHQPIEQSKVAAARGGAAYKHVKTLLEKGLIEAEKCGRTLILRTTTLFAELFNVDDNPSAIKRKLEERMRDLGIDLKTVKAE